jgi:hypothetical protein
MPHKMKKRQRFTYDRNSTAISQNVAKKGLREVNAYQVAVLSS